MKMLKLASIVTSFVAIVGIAACGRGDSTTQKAVDTTVVTSKVRDTTIVKSDTTVKVDTVKKTHNIPVKKP